jgi:hypothetical protein
VDIFNKAKMAKLKETLEVYRGRNKQLEKYESICRDAELRVAGSGRLVSGLERLDVYLYTYCEINKGELVNASMSIFIPGSIEPVSIYPSKKREAPMANPIVSDGNGRFPKAFLDRPYRVVITNRCGVVIFEDDYQ